MVSLYSGNRYLLYQGWADARKSFDGLSGIVTNEMRLPLQTGDIFIFINRKRTHLKLLQWEGDGYGIYGKRLEEGTFEMPAGSAGIHSQLTSRQLMLILQGVSLKKVVYRKRYRPRQIARDRLFKKRGCGLANTPFCGPSLCFGKSVGRPGLSTGALYKFRGSYR